MSEGKRISIRRYQSGQANPRQANPRLTTRYQSGQANPRQANPRLTTPGAMASAQPPKSSDMIIGPVKLTLASHPGKALVLLERIDYHGHGHWLGVGDPKHGRPAVIIDRPTNSAQASLRLSDQPELGLHIAEGPHNTREGNALLFGTWDHPPFVFNLDGTIAPQVNPSLVLGFAPCQYHDMAGRELVVFVTKGSKQQLVFDNIIGQPSEFLPREDLQRYQTTITPQAPVQLNPPLTLTLASHPGQGLVLLDRIDYHGYGHYLGLGPAHQAVVIGRQNTHSGDPSKPWEKASLRVFGREELGLHITGGGHDAKEGKVVMLGAWGCCPPFAFHQDGTISPQIDPTLVLGFGPCREQRGRELVKFVRKGSGQQLVFDQVIGQNPEFLPPDILQRYRTLEVKPSIKDKKKRDAREAAERHHGCCCGRCLCKLCVFIIGAAIFGAVMGPLCSAPEGSQQLQACHNILHMVYHFRE